MAAALPCAMESSIVSGPVAAPATKTPGRDVPDIAFVEWLTRDMKVAAIPVSAFSAAAEDEGVVRFCFAKHDDTLDAACERLAAL